MDSRIYLIECLTNLHVGSNTEDYDIVDKKVQRDPITDAPIIQASGLKGAIREYFDFDPSINTELSSEIKLTLFGSEKNTGDRKAFQRGGLKFFDARLLFFPIRLKSGNQTFILASNENILQEFMNFHGLLNGHSALKFVKSDYKILNTFDTEFGEFESIQFNFLSLSFEIILMSYDTLSKQVFKQLPVIARNKLINGESKNLWYEEIVPRKTVFYTGIQKTNFKPNEAFDFNTAFNKYVDNNVIQIGANASVGYGDCLFKFRGLLNIHKNTYLLEKFSNG